MRAVFFDIGETLINESRVWSHLAYVGDRVDNDVVPVAAAGLVPIHLIRGPWGYIQKDWPDSALARAQITTLAELPRILARL